MKLGEPAAVVLRYTVYEGDVLSGWTEDEVAKYHDADADARRAFSEQAVELARSAGGAPDIEVLVDGSTIWTNT